MADRLSLQTTLERLHGSPNVYYQPPASIKMNYPAIVYDRSNIDEKFANDKAYSRKNSYKLIVIDTRPENQVIGRLLDLPYCRFVQHYVSDGLHHDVLSLYY